MNRLTKEDTNKVCYDCWELCELDDVCKRNCFEPTPCKIPSMISKLAKYEDTGVEPEEIKEALEKQIPKNPRFEDYGYVNGELVYDPWVCPSCNEEYESDYDYYKYCPECGQKLDWEVKE